MKINTLQAEKLELTSSLENLSYEMMSFQNKVINSDVISYQLENHNNILVNDIDKLNKHIVNTSLTTNNRLKQPKIKSNQNAKDFF